MILKKYSHLIVSFFIVGVILFGSGPYARSNTIVQGENDTLQMANNHFDHFSTARHNYIVEWIRLMRLDMQRAALKVQYKSNKTTMEKEAIELAAAVAPKSVMPADYVFNISEIAASAAKLSISASNAVDLQRKLVEKNIEIKAKIDVVAQHKTAVDTTYTHYVAHINAFNAANARNRKSPSANATAAPKGYIPPETDDQGNLKDPVSVDSDIEVKCGNPSCKTVYKASTYGLENIVALSEGGSSGGYNGHKVTCNIPHALPIIKNGNKYGGGAEVEPNPYSYWSCPPKYSGCDRKMWHKALCRGGCQTYFGTLAGSTIPVDYAHLTDCNERIPESQVKLFGRSDVFVDCPGRYHDCMGQTSSSCRYVNQHVGNTGGDDSANANPNPSQPSTPTTPTTPTTPVMAACGVHETTVSGDHSWIIPPCGDDTHAMYACQVTSSHSTLQASCSATNSYGDGCSVSGFYACQNHSHQFPTRVRCRRSACTEMVLSDLEHRTTCHYGRTSHYYWTCNPDDVEMHKTRTCTRIKVVRQVWVAKRNRYEARWGVCGESFANCNRRSTCKNAYGAFGNHKE